MKEKILGLLLEAQDFVSGQQLCEQFGVSRTAVWKVIHQLQEAGYEIEAVRNKGYRLLSEPDLLSESVLEQTMATDWIGHPIYYFSEVDSTNNVAKRMAEEEAGHGTLVVADYQSTGRGRRGRSFASPKGCGIWMSLVLKPDIEPANASMLTLVMAMAVLRGLEKSCSLPLQIKWPNDIVCSGKKICGILTEMSAQVDCINNIVIGTGINVHNSEFPEELQQLATSVYLESGKKIRRAQLIADIMQAFEVYYEKYLRTQDLQEIVEEYNAALINCNRQVRVLDPKGEYEGKALGIDARGELMVQTRTEVKYVSAGEVSVRGVYGYV